MKTWEAQLETFLQLLMSPAGLVAAALLAVLAVVAVVRPAWRYVALALLLWSTCLGRPTGYYNLPSLVGPLEQLVDYSRSLTLAMLLVLVLPAMIVRGPRAAVIPAASIVFILYHLVIGLVELGVGEATKAAAGLVVIGMAFFVLARGVGQWLQDDRAVRGIYTAVAVAGVIFVALTCIQGVINPDAITWNGRLFATTANPQFAAVNIAVIFPIVAYLAVQRGIWFPWRLMLFGVIGLFVIFLGWTGSRTGMLMSVIGLMLLFRLRLGRLALAAGGAAIIVLIGLQVFGDEIEGADRLLSTKNTRLGVWQSMFSAFLRNPLLGSQQGEFDGSENSYLWTGARYGLVGLSLLLLTVVLVIRQVIRIHAARRVFAVTDQRHVLTCDLVVAGLVALGAGSWFEGFLLGQFHLAVYLTFIHLAVSKYLLDKAEGLVPLEVPDSPGMALQSDYPRYPQQASVPHPA